MMTARQIAYLREDPIALETGGKDLALALLEVIDHYAERAVLAEFRLEDLSC